MTNGNEHQISHYQGLSYTYINDERLSSVNAGHGVSYQLAYDALGRCVKRTSNGAQTSVTTYFIYDGEKPILEYAAGGAQVGINIYGKGIDEILQRGAYGADHQWHWYFLNQDHEGSVTHLTDVDGTIIEKYRYDAFGTPSIYNGGGVTIPTTAYNNRFLFTGREYDGAWMYEYRARMYHSYLGGFMSEDPKLFDAGDYNLFRYCHNDPINHTDPMGLQDTVATYSPRQTSQMDDRAYNFIMGLMQQARREAQSISEGTENRSGRQIAMPVKGEPLRPGLAPTTEEQKAYGVAGAERMGELTQGSMEANVAIGYNMETRKYGYSGYVMSRPVLSSQQAPTPALPPGRWVYAGQAHGHHGRIGFSGYDFHWANMRGLPIFIHNARGVSMYVPPANQSSLYSPIGGHVFGPGEF